MPLAFVRRLFDVCRSRQAIACCLEAHREGSGDSAWGARLEGVVADGGGIAGNEAVAADGGSVLRAHEVIDVELQLELIERTGLIDMVAGAKVREESAVDAVVVGVGEVALAHVVSADVSIEALVGVGELGLIEELGRVNGDLAAGEDRRGNAA